MVTSSGMKLITFECSLQISDISIRASNHVHFLGSSGISNLVEMQNRVWEPLSFPNFINVPT